MTFTNCQLKSTRLYNFLKGLRGLKTIEYFSVNSSMECSEAREIVDALCAHAKGTLQTLRLRSSSGFMNHAGTLVDFEGMKELEISIALLFLLKIYTLPDRVPQCTPPSIEKVHLTCLETNLHYMVEIDVLDMAIFPISKLPGHYKEAHVEGARRNVGRGEVKHLPDVASRAQRKLQ